MKPLESLIHTEIREQGPRTFARFMELALYHPEWGYYSREGAARKIGRTGDFFTSVSVGPLFGRLLACQFVEWWKILGEPNPFHIVECGGSNGQLAHDIRAILQRDFPQCWEATYYLLVEPLPRLMQFQKTLLAHSPRIHWVSSINDLHKVHGIIFGNELMDAFPVHKLENIFGKWMECCIDIRDGKLVWVHRPCPEKLAISLPANMRGQVESNLQAVHWLKDASNILHQGYMLLLDYGWMDEEYFQVPRPQGTVRGYRDHHLVENVLANPGEQDITAHVRWTPLMEEAGDLGLHIQEFIHQSRWLTRIVAENKLQLNVPEIRQFNTLTHPEMMGTPFRTLVLKK